MESNMKMKTKELTGSALDWAVGMATPQDVRIGASGRLYIVQGYTPFELSPSTNWAQGGLIIEREGIEITRCNDLYFPKGNEKGDYYEPYWKATIDLDEGDYMIHKEYGPTPLIAAMRCYVNSILGDEVDIPEELVKDN